MPEQNQHNLFEELLNQDESLTEKQKKILESAIEIFAEKGYSATSTNEIAKKAGVAEGTIFRHYKTKKDLLLSIVAPTMAKLVAPFVIKDLNKVLDTKYETYEAFLKALILNRQAFLKENMAAFRILIQEIPFHPELKEQFKEHIANKLFERVQRIIEHYQELGQVISMPSQAVLRFTLSSIFGFLIARHLLLPEADWDNEKEIEYTIHMIMNGVKASSI
ncbi:AcrR family transcriptional regulator [Bacillus pakistanensis]|uniref:AcrR family transcriptional regulator n=1 Tax=Rossellomorea pakistanensis TaxID=992288 RepID=A0ABS2NBG8_9BACI|nr:TetR/AcrR family transcriptional regulator [Bacillus pakistanensis]MBM7585178.1 AcrR family transcriptional regulator [Bacillus pakistanensis]